MAREIGIKRILVVANKIRSDEDLVFLQHELAGLPLIGALPFVESLLRADRNGVSVRDGAGAEWGDRFTALFETLVQQLGKENTWA